MWTARLIAYAVLALALLALVFWLKRYKLVVTWYEWLIGSMGLILLLFALDSIIGFAREHEATAAWNSVLIFVLPAVVLIAVAVGLPARRCCRSRKAAT